MAQPPCPTRVARAGSRRGRQESVDEIPAGIRDYARTRKAAEKMPALEALLDAVDGSGDATSASGRFGRCI